MRKELLALLVGLCATLDNNVWAETISGFVTAITDGDTIKLLDSNHQLYRVRVEGIDAPEKGQPFGAKSEANMGRLAFNKNVVANCPKHDRYGRLVCKVTVNGIDVGFQQIEDGMAWWYRKYATEQSPEDRENYERAESMAKLRRLGLWAEQNPVPPWDWRHR